MIQKYFPVFLVIAAGVISGIIFTEFARWPSIDIVPLFQRWAGIYEFTNDTFVNSLDSFTARTYFASTLFFVWQLLGAPDIFWFIAIGNILLSVSIGLSIYYLAKHLRLPIWLSVLASAIVMLQLVNDPEIGRWNFWINFLPWAIATNCMLWAIFAIITKRRWLRFGLLIVSTLTHPGVTLGMLPLLVLLHWAFGYKVYSLKQLAVETIASVVTVGGVVVAAFGAPLHFLQPNGSGLTAEQLYNIYVHMRHPHHYEFASYLPYEWQRFAYYAVAWAASMLLLWQLKAWRWLAFASSVALFIAWSLLTHWLFVQVWPTELGIMIAPVRSIVITWPLFVIITLYTIRQLFMQQPAAAWTSLAMFTVLAVFGVKDILLLLPAGFITSAIIIPWTKTHNATLQTSWHYITRSLLVRLRLQQASVQQTTIIISSVVATLSILGLAMYYVLFTQSFQNQVATNYTELGQCLEQHVAIDMPLISVQSISPILLRYYTGYSVYGDIAFPFNNGSIQPWFQEYVNVHGNVPLNINNDFRHSIQPNDIADISARTGLRYFIFTNSPKLDTYNVICKTSRYSLIQVN